MIKICENCGEEFKGSKKRKFCSKKCYGESVSTSQIVKCPYCGKERIRQLKDIKRYSKLYCSIECRNKHALVGSNSPKYKERVLKNCFVCDKQIEVTQARNVESNVCSEECRIALLRIFAEGKKINREIVKCSFCGDDIDRSPYKIKYKKNLFCNKKCKSDWQKINQIGENNPSWKGGKTSLDDTIRASAEYYEARKICYKRDNYSSILSGVGGNTGKGRLNHHHLTPISYLINKYEINKDNWREFKDILFDVNNIVTLLESEHILFHKLNGKVSTKEQFEEFKNNKLWIDLN